MRRLHFVLLAIVFQVAVLAHMAAKREWIVRTAPTVWLRTAPIDPRDLFRGDYVRLDYELSTLPTRLYSDALRQAIKRGGAKLKPGTTVYVALRIAENGLGEAIGVDLKPPASGPCLRGRPSDRWQNLDYGMRIAYGIEAYFVQQDTGKELERGRGTREGMQVPMEMKVALAADGTAVLTGFRWSVLGMKLELTGVDPNRGWEGGRSQPVPAGTRQTAIAKVTLQNHSDKPVAVIDAPNCAAWRLEANVQFWGRDGERQWDCAHNRQPLVPLREQHVRVLAPQETVTWTIDLALPEWFVAEPGKIPVALGTLEWGETFRLVYAPPEAAACAELPQKELIWHGRFSSRAFHGRGRVD